MEDKKGFNEEEHRQAYLRDCQKFKNFFSNKRNLFIAIIVLIFLVTFSLKYSNTLQEQENETNNIGSYEKSNVSNIDQEEQGEGFNKNEIENEKNVQEEERMKVISEVFGDHQIEFANQTLSFKKFYYSSDDALSLKYSSDILDNYAQYEIDIFQYGDKISLSDLIDQKGIDIARHTYTPSYIRSDIYEGEHYIILCTFDHSYSRADLYLMKFLEVEGKTYKIVFTKRIDENVLDDSLDWIDRGYQNFLNDFKGVDLNFAQDVFHKSVEIKNELSKSNIYNDVKWEKEVIEENSPYSDIDIEYPKFSGFEYATDLNNIINEIVLDTLEEDREYIENWKSDEKSSYIDEEGNIISDCYGDQDYFYSCSVNLHSSFKVKSIVNNIISIEIILTDYTGGGNGNHSYVKTIMFDLKNGKQIYIDDLFCGDNYLGKIKEILKANIAIGYVYDNNIKDLSDEELLSYLREVSFNDFGFILSFNPYIFTPDIYNIFIPYTILEDDLCFKDGAIIYL